MVWTSVEATVAESYEFMVNCDKFCLERCQYDFKQICNYEDPCGQTLLQRVLGKSISECQIDTRQIDTELNTSNCADAVSCDSLPDYLEFMKYITQRILTNSYQKEKNESNLKKLFLEKFSNSNSKNLSIQNSMSFTELEEQLCYSNMLTELNCYTILIENGFLDEFLVSLMQQRNLPFSLLSFAIKLGFLDNTIKENFKNKIFEILIDMPSINPQKFSETVDLHFKKLLNEIKKIEEYANSATLESSIIDERDITHNVKGRRYAKKLGSKALKDSKVRKVRRKIEKISKLKMNKSNSHNIIDLNIINETASKEIEKIDFESIIMATEYCVEAEKTNFNNHANDANLTITTENLLHNTDNSKFYNNFFQEIEQKMGNENSPTYQDENDPSFSEIEEIRRMLESEKIVAKQ